jgi:hypothetical protein
MNGLFHRTGPNEHGEHEEYYLSRDGQHVSRERIQSQRSYPLVVQTDIFAIGTFLRRVACHEAKAALEVWTDISMLNQPARLGPRARSLAASSAEP